ncbi:MAG: DUF4194 domain-containing protein [Brevibacillus sp.]|nr:DUF4194 domain-containing protein [Brevibacillus sp.]
MIFNGISESEQEKISALINRLLATNFIVKEKEREAYGIARRHREALERYFRFLGWDLVIDERHECLFLHAPEQGLRKKLNKDQSLWLLILRLIYQEKREGLSLSEFPMTTLYEIRSKYETFRIPWINRTKLAEMVRLCTSYQLMEALDSDFRSDECRFRLFHTWIYLIDADEMNVVKEKIERYETALEGGMFDEMDEEIEAH